MKHRKTVNQHKLKSMFFIEKFEETIRNILSGKVLYKTEDGRLLDFAEGKVIEKRYNILLQKEEYVTHNYKR